MRSLKNEIMKIPLLIRILLNVALGYKITKFDEQNLPDKNIIIKRIKYLSQYF